MTDPNSHTWTYTYNANGYRTKKRDPLGNKATYSYDVIPEASRGRLQALRRVTIEVAGLLGPAAGGLITANRLYNGAEKDGSVIAKLERAVRFTCGDQRRLSEEERRRRNRQHRDSAFELRARPSQHAEQAEERARHDREPEREGEQVPGRECPVRDRVGRVRLVRRAAVLA